MVWNVICMIVFGAVIGMLARLFLRGNQHISALMTVVLGIVGALVGYYLAALLGVDHTKGIDWIRDIISVVVAMICIAIYTSVAGRGNRAVTR